MLPSAYFFFAFDFAYLVRKIEKFDFFLLPILLAKESERKKCRNKK
jgi:hypothetical protein